MQPLYAPGCIMDNPVRKRLTAKLLKLIGQQNIQVKYLLFGFYLKKLKICTF